MNSIAKAATLNNQGVQLLVSGNTSHAMSAFHVALQILKKLAAVELSSRSQPRTSNKNVEAARSLPIVKSEAITQDNDQCYLYKRGLLIVDIPNGCFRNEDIAHYTAVALFNWALAFHREGRLGHGEAEYLNNALSLYKTCMSIPRESLGTIGQCADATTSFITVAVLNNMSQIYFDRMQYGESLACLDLIVQIFEVTEDLDEALSDMDMEVVFLNTLLVHKPTVAHAA